MIKYVLLDARCEPFVGSANAAGADLRTYLYSKDGSKMLPLEPGQTLMVGTGVRAQIPDGWVGIIAPRSSTGQLRIALENTLGVIDSDYTGEIKLRVYNFGNEVQMLNNFERIVQLIVVPHMSANHYEIVKELDVTDRGANGFGSTGK